MARKKLHMTILDRAGNSVPNATATIYEPGTTTPLVASIFSAITGPSTLSNPLTTGLDGSIEFYLDAGQRVNIKVTAAGMDDRTFAYVPVLDDPAELVHLTGAETLANKTLTGAILTSPTIDGAVMTNTDMDGVEGDFEVGAGGNGNLAVAGKITQLGWEHFNLWARGGDPGAGADNLALLEDIVDEMGSGGGILHIPAGVWNISGELDWDKPGMIHGDGMHTTFLRCTSSTSNVIKCSAPGGIQNTIKGIGIIRSGGLAASGAGILISPSDIGSGGAQNGTLIEDVYVLHSYRNIQIDSSVGWKIRGCRLAEPGHSCIYLDAPGSADSGDAAIDGGTLLICSSSVSGKSGLYMVAGGGIKISNAKFLGFEVMANFALRSGANMSAVTFGGGTQMQGVSGTVSAIQIARTAGTGFFYTLIVNGVEMVIDSGTVINELSSGDSGGAPWLAWVTIMNSLLQVTGTGTNNGIALAGGTHYDIMNNRFSNRGAGTLQPLVNSGATDVNWGQNIYENTTANPFSGTEPERQSAYIDSSNRHGFGTPSPSYQIHLKKSDASAVALAVENSHASGVAALRAISAGGDCFAYFNNGTKEWYAGLDSSNSNQVVIGLGSAPGAADNIRFEDSPKITTMVGSVQGSVAAASALPALGFAGTSNYKNTITTFASTGTGTPPATPDGYWLMRLDGALCGVPYYVITTT